MYTNAQYLNESSTSSVPMAIRCDVNGITSFVPIDTMNGDYNEIMRLVAVGELVIAPAS